MSINKTHYRIKELIKIHAVNTDARLICGACAASVPLPLLARRAQRSVAIDE